MIWLLLIPLYIYIFIYKCWCWLFRLKCDKVNSSKSGNRCLIEHLNTSIYIQTISNTAPSTIMIIYWYNSDEHWRGSRLSFILIHSSIYRIYASQTCVCVCVSQLQIKLEGVQIVLIDGVLISLWEEENVLTGPPFGSGVYIAFCGGKIRLYIMFLSVLVWFIGPSSRAIIMHNKRIRRNAVYFGIAFGNRKDVCAVLVVGIAQLWLKSAEKKLIAL